MNIDCCRVARLAYFTAKNRIFGVIELRFLPFGGGYFDFTANCFYHFFVFFMIFALFEKVGGKTLNLTVLYGPLGGEPWNSSDTPPRNNILHVASRRADANLARIKSIVPCLAKTRRFWLFMANLTIFRLALWWIQQKTNKVFFVSWQRRYQQNHLINNKMWTKIIYIVVFHWT